MSVHGKSKKAPKQNFTEKLFQLALAISKPIKGEGLGSNRNTIKMLNQLAVSKKKKSKSKKKGKK